MNIRSIPGDGLRRMALTLTWVALMSALFAQAEIQIEGAAGWAANLPTWRIPQGSGWELLFGGRSVTGYHVFTSAFMLVAFHLGPALDGRWSLKLEARIIGCLMLFWILEDALWFALNPAYGLSRLTPGDAPWHPHWLLGVPSDYIVMSACAVLLLTVSTRGTVRLREENRPCGC